MILKKVDAAPQTYTQTNAPVQALANAIQNQSGVVDIRSGEAPVYIMPLPKSSNYTIANSNASGAEEVTVWVFNEDVLKNTLTDNVIASGKEPVISYNDGFSGKLISQLIKFARGGRGMRVREITITGKNASGVQDDAAISSMDLAVQGYQAIRGTAVPQNYDLTEALRNTQFKDGMVTVKVDFFINCVNQIVFTCPKGYSYDLNFVWDYSDMK